MMLTPEQRVRFARHRLLAEIGDVGQLALLAADSASALSDAGAELVRSVYLERAGMAPETSGSAPCDVAAFAGTPYLVEAAASCLGAFAAVERIKTVVGTGVPASLPLPVRLVEPA